MATPMRIEKVIDQNGKTRDVEVFVFHNPRKQRKEVSTVSSLNDQSASKKQAASSSGGKRAAEMVMDLESARNDVRSLGIKGFTGCTRIEAELAQLKKLGAKIPKNWERKMEKKKRHEEFQRHRQDLKAGMKTKAKGKPKATMDKPEKKKREGKGFVDSQVGKYKDGVQFISKAEIHKIRNSAGKAKR